MTKPRHKYQYAVRYRRRGWKSAQVRFLQSRPCANRLRTKLLRGAWDLAPIVELTIERRELGPVETVWTLDSGRVGADSRTVEPDASKFEWRP